jgi:hypothetical protein
LIFCCEVPTPYSIVKSILNYQKKIILNQRWTWNHPLPSKLFMHLPIQYVYHIWKSVQSDPCPSIKDIFLHILAYSKNICVFFKNIQRTCLPSSSNRTHLFVRHIYAWHEYLSICFLWQLCLPCFLWHLTWPKSIFSWISIEF